MTVARISATARSAVAEGMAGGVPPAVVLLRRGDPELAVGRGLEVRIGAGCDAPVGHEILLVQRLVELGQRPAGIDEFLQRSPRQQGIFLALPAFLAGEHQKAWGAPTCCCRSGPGPSTARYAACSSVGSAASPTMISPTLDVLAQLEPPTDFGAPAQVEGIASAVTQTTLPVNEPGTALTQPT